MESYNKFLNVSFTEGIYASHPKQMKFTSFSRQMHWVIVHVKQLLHREKHEYTADM